MSERYALLFVPCRRHDDEPLPMEAVVDGLAATAPEGEHVFEANEPEGWRELWVARRAMEWGQALSAVLGTVVVTVDYDDREDPILEWALFDEGHHVVLGCVGDGPCFVGDVQGAARRLGVSEARVRTFEDAVWRTKIGEPVDLAAFGQLPELDDFFSWPSAYFAGLGLSGETVDEPRPLPLPDRPRASLSLPPLLGWPDDQDD